MLFRSAADSLISIRKVCEKLLMPKGSNNCNRHEKTFEALDWLAAMPACASHADRELQIDYSDSPCLPTGRSFLIMRKPFRLRMFSQITQSVKAISGSKEGERSF